MKQHEMVLCDQYGNLILSPEEAAVYNGFKRLCRCAPSYYLPTGKALDWQCRNCKEDVPAALMACPKCRDLKIE